MIYSPPFDLSYILWCYKIFLICWDDKHMWSKRLSFDSERWGFFWGLLQQTLGFNDFLHGDSKIPNLREMVKQWARLHAMFQNGWLKNKTTNSNIFWNLFWHETMNLKTSVVFSVHCWCCSLSTRPRGWAVMLRIETWRCSCDLGMVRHFWRVDVTRYLGNLNIKWVIHYNFII